MPPADKYEVSVALLTPLFELANKYKIGIYTHTDNVANSGKFKPLMKKYPETILILYHASPAEEAFDLVNSYENVYIDVSYLAWGKEFQQNALRTIGKHKILFGIDSPLGFPKDNDKFLPHYRDAAYEVAKFYNFNKDIVERVLYKNAAKLLNIELRTTK